MSTWNWSLNGLPLQVGPSAKAADGVSGQLRGAYDRSVVTVDGHARYQEAAQRGNLFACVNSAAQALSLTGTTTYTGLIVYNAPNSGKNLVLLEALYAQTIAETGVGAVLLFSQAVATSLPALTTTTVSTSPFAGIVISTSGGSAAKVASSCTLAANPIFLRPLISRQWVTATAQSTFVAKDEIAGSLIVPPGAGVGFVALTTATTGIGYISWEEVPI